MTLIPPSDSTVRRSGYTNTAPATSGQPATPATPPQAAAPAPATSGQAPAQIETPSTFQGTPGADQDPGFSPVNADIFKKIQQAEAIANKTELAPAQMDPEMAAILQRFKQALAEMSPPPDSQLARIVNQFKAVVDKLAEKLETGKDNPATPPASSEGTPAPTAAEPAASTSETPAAAEPTAATEPESPSTDPAVTEAVDAADAADDDAEIVAAEDDNDADETDETGGSDTPTGGTVTNPESPKETDNPAVKSPEEMLKGSMEELLAMFQKKRLDEQLNAFGEEQLQKIRDAMNQAAKLLRGMP